VYKVELSTLFFSNKKNNIELGEYKGKHLLLERKWSVHINCVISTHFVELLMGKIYEHPRSANA
jgi:hypothetical protein